MNNTIDRVSPDLMELDILDEVSTIACVIPAYNEEDSIAATLESLMSQTRPPNTVYVVVNNTNDDTLWVAKEYEGKHEISSRGEVFECNIVVTDIGKNADKKVGALNWGWGLAKSHTYILGVDGDTILDKKCVEQLLAEMDADSRIGGISAIYSFAPEEGTGLIQKFLVAGQKQQFAGFEMDNLLRNRNMAVLGGQCSLLRVAALKEVMRLNRQSSPWVTDSSVEDSLLSLQIKSAGYSTKISARARADVGAMMTLKSLYAQQLKWNHGAIELMRLKPFHPNLRLRWRENASMVFNILTRLMFALLLVASISVNAFVFAPVWLIPPVASWLLNIRTAYSMKNRTGSDTAFAFLFITSEIYMLIRITHFIAAWYHSIAKVEKDTWGMQSAAESGKGTTGVLWPIAGTALIALVAYTSWIGMEWFVKLTILSIGWPILAVIAVLLTLTVLKRLVRRHRGFMV